jgi:hypothetical protein
LTILAIWPLNFCISSPRRSLPLPAYVSFAVARKNHWYIDLADLHDTRGRHYIHDDAQAFHLLYGDHIMSHGEQQASIYNAVQPDEHGEIPGIVAPFHVRLDNRGRIVLPEGIMTRDGAEVMVDRNTPMPTRPASPAPPPPPPPQEQTMIQLVAGLIASQQVTNTQLGLLSTAMADMSRAVAAASTTRSVVNSVYKPPQPFKGQRGPDARRFLAVFWVWATQQPQLQDYEQWIAAVFGYLHDDAAIWATPYLEQQKRGETPFDGSWTKFEEKFKARFETVDEQYDAIEYIKSLKQGSMSVVEYVAKFAEYKDRTGFSPEDLRERLREGLASYIKDAMAVSERKTSTYEELVDTAQILDKRYQERRAEKAREQGRSVPAAAKPYLPSFASPHSAGPAPAPHRDPNAMDVDATKAIAKTLKDYNDWMKGRCYGCGSHSHVKAEGNHGADLCGHCGKTGHRADVCQRKFFGHPPSAPRRANATTTDTVATTPAADSGDGTASVKAAATSTTSSFEDMMRSMQQQQAALAQQLADLKSCF